jgi:hypothetical protein
MIGPLALLFGIVLAALWTPWVWQRLRRAVHILQLEEYDNARALRWAARSWLPDRAPVAVVAVTLAFAALLVTTLAERGLATILTAAGVFALLGLVLPLRFRARPEKKPLAVTMRVRRLFGALAIVFLLLGLLLALLIWLGGLPGGAADCARAGLAGRGARAVGGRGRQSAGAACRGGDQATLPQRGDRAAAADQPQNRRRDGQLRQDYH